MARPPSGEFAQTPPTGADVLLAARDGTEQSDQSGGSRADELEGELRRSRSTRSGSSTITAATSISSGASEERPPAAVPGSLADQLRSWSLDGLGFEQIHSLVHIFMEVASTHPKQVSP